MPGWWDRVRIWLEVLYEQDFLAWVLLDPGIHFNGRVAKELSTG